MSLSLFLSMFPPRPKVPFGGEINQMNPLLFCLQSCEKQVYFTTFLNH